MNYANTLLYNILRVNTAARYFVKANRLYRNVLHNLLREYTGVFSVEIYFILYSNISHINVLVSFTKGIHCSEVHIYTLKY